MTGWRKPDSAFLAPAMGSAMFEGFCRTFFSCYCPLTVEGRHHLPGGPFLLCSNHTSHIDSAALMTASGRCFRTFALLGASDYFFDGGSARWLVSPFMNVIPIERRPHPKSLATCLAMCHQFLRQTGGILILYPEGTRSPDGEMQALKTGAGMFAVELGVPLVPAYIEGAHRILPKGKSVPQPGRLTVRFGEALAPVPPSSTEVSLRDRRRFAVEQLAQRIQLLSPGYRIQGLVARAQEKG
jgi:1-acyl-sn-glycerol-3-phosphate acyltransferase